MSSTHGRRTIEEGQVDDEVEVIYTKKAKMNDEENGVNGKEDETMPKASNIFVQEHKVTREHRGRLLAQSVTTSTTSTSTASPGKPNSGAGGRFCGGTVWLTGLSGAGKTTIAFALEEYLVAKGIFCYGLDGDNVRNGLCSNLGFSAEDRDENIRRVTEVAKLFADSGAVCIGSFVSPFKKHRDFARQVHESANLAFIEVFVDTPLEVCEQRDTKGLYKMAREGKIKGFTGIDQPYDRPENPELSVQTVEENVGECVCRVLKAMAAASIIPSSAYKEAEEWFKAKEVAKSAEIKQLSDNQQLWMSKVSELFTSDKEAFMTEAESLDRLEITRTDLEWLQVLSEGWAAPLTGFMRESQYLECLHFNCLFDNKGSKSRRKVTNQSIPIVLALNDTNKTRLEGKKAVSLVYEGQIYAIVRNPDFFPHRKEERCCRTFGTCDQRHPTIKAIYQSGDWLIGGDVEVKERIMWNDGLDAYRKTPNELRQQFLVMKSDAVFAFQLRNPVHNGHALLMTDCREQLMKRGYRNPVLLLHPLGGWTKDDDVPLDVRMRQHDAILQSKVLDPKSTVLAIFPSPMSYAGPTEVQWHAKARTAAGANFYIVGRDPAGLPRPDGSGVDLYDPTHGARVLAAAPGLEELEIIRFKVAAYDKTVSKMAFFDAGRAMDFLKISGSEMRRLAKTGEDPPDGFMAKMAWDVLAEFYKGQQQSTK